MKTPEPPLALVRTSWNAVAAHGVVVDTEVGAEGGVIWQSGVGRLVSARVVSPVPAARRRSGADAWPCLQRVDWPAVRRSHQG